MSDRPYQVLELDSRASDIGLLRFWAAVLVLIAGVWLAATSPPAWAWIAVVAAAFFAIFWFRRWVRSGVARQGEGASYLALGEPGFRLCLGREVTEISWLRVCALEADEERVAVRVGLADPVDTLYVEPTWGGLGLYELQDAMRAALEASRSRLD